MAAMTPREVLVSKIREVHGQEDYPQILHGLSTDSPWIIHGFSIDGPKIIHGLSIDYP